MGSRKRQSAEKIKEAKKDVAFAKLNNCPTSPRKMRLVADSVRGKKVDSALTILKFSQKDASNKLEKLPMGMKIKEDMTLDETIKAVQNKAKKTGMPYSILKQVYNRGMAAWKGGHRPGATQQQWALARVNSFVTKSSGTWGGADKDLAAKVRGSKK